MTAIVVQPIQRLGNLSGFHRLYRQAAHAAANSIHESHRELGKTWRRLDASNGEVFLHEYLRQLEAYVVLAATAEMSARNEN